MGLSYYVVTEVLFFFTVCPIIIMGTKMYIFNVDDERTARRRAQAKRKKLKLLHSRGKSTEEDEEEEEEEEEEEGKCRTGRKRKKSSMDEGRVFAFLFHSHDILPGHPCLPPDAYPPSLLPLS